MAPLIALPRASGIPASFRWPVEFCVAITAVTYVLSIVTGNVSQVDRLWTFLPTIYSGYFALLPLWPTAPPKLLPLFPYVPHDINHNFRAVWSERALLMFGLQVIWMFRLSYNTWRRGLFSFSEEDYRWAILRKKMPVWMFQIINLTFIAIIQNILLFLLAVPTHNAMVHSLSAYTSTPNHLVASDYGLAFASLVTLALEFTADNQQYSYQTFKHEGASAPGSKWPGAMFAWTEEEVKRGFVTRGLWAWSRHPNFACEQTFWILQNMFPILCTSSWLTTASTKEFIIQLIPSICICALFNSSTMFSESVSLSKYPDGYKAYKKRVAMFFPWMTPIWGLLIRLREGQVQKELIDTQLFGRGSTKKDV